MNRWVMHVKRILFILVILALYNLCACQNDKVFVINKEGTILQKSLTENPQRMFKLLSYTNVIVIEKSKKIFFQKKYDNWTKIKFGDFEGWVLSEDISAPIPENNICEFSYVSGANDFLIVYINFFKNKRFDFYIDFIEDYKSGVYIVSGSWNSNDNQITMIFDRNQPNCNKCITRDFFIKDNETPWDTNVTIVDDYTVRFNKDLDKLIVYGNPCNKYE